MVEKDSGRLQGVANRTGWAVDAVKARDSRGFQLSLLSYTVGTHERSAPLIPPSALLVPSKRNASVLDELRSASAGHRTGVIGEGLGAALLLPAAGLQAKLCFIVASLPCSLIFTAIRAFNHPIPLTPLHGGIVPCVHAHARDGHEEACASPSRAAVEYGRPRQTTHDASGDTILLDDGR